MKEYNVVGMAQQDELTKSRQLSSLNFSDMFQAIKKLGNTTVLLPLATAHHFSVSTTGTLIFKAMQNVSLYPLI
jgi:hypothetical protein